MPNHRPAVLTILLGITLTLGADTFAQVAPGTARGRFPIHDRNGVVLYSPPANEAAAAFPYRALGAQLLDSLLETEGGGDKLVLTLDARIQFAAEEVLRAVPRGAAVVLDAQTGDVLAMASVPSFDPNGLTADARARLAADPTQPLMNRALTAVAPGSTFVPVTALASASAGHSDRKYECMGSITYGNKVLRCWIDTKGERHGSLAVEDALAASCGPFFYQAANDAGIEKLAAIGRLLGFGKLSGLGLRDEQPGILPTPDYLREIAPTEKWSLGYTANTAIGQGFTMATPLQLARMAAAVGNGGHVPELRLRLDVPVLPAVDLQEHGISEEALEPIRRGLRKVVESGTGQRAQLEGITVSGKTGTAQVWRRPNMEKDSHTWFIAYAPADKPKVAVCVLVQGGKAGGTVAAPLAARIIERALRAELAPAKAMDAAKGSFLPVESVEAE